MHLILETERLFIRPLKSTDSNFILSLVNSKGWIKYIGDRNIKNIADADAYIQTIQQNKNFFYNVFERKDTNQAIGIITFLFREEQDFPDLGFAILPEFEGKGYTFEASKKYLNELLLNFTHQKVLGITLSDNTKSINLLERLGLKFEKTVKKENEKISIYSLNL